MEKKKKFKEKYLIWKKDMKEIMHPLIISLIFFFITSSIAIMGGRYTTKVGTVPAPDIILDNIPVIDLVFIFFWGINILIAFFFVYVIFIETKRAPRLILMVSLLYLIRGIFIVLTHLSTPIEAIQVPLYFENDVFFSGHTAFPFLCFLMFRKWWAKIAMLFSSILMGIVVLVTHRHYSIDVAAAFFITYAIYALGNKIFGIKKDKGS